VNLVLDASLTLSWYFEDERTPAVDAVLDQVAAGGAVVPSLWRLEVANGFQMAIRRKRIDRTFRDNAFRQLALLPITVETETDLHAWSSTVNLADQFDLTIYDAAYLELAHRRSGLPLASLDEKLCTAGQALGIPLLGA
jgi:predicted nucleic acid-binding protein